MALSFADDLKAKCEKALREVDKAVQHIAFTCFTSVVLKTPVLTGALSNNWFPSVGADFSTEVTSALDRTGSGSKARIYSILGQNTFYRKDGSITLANNLPYAYRAEYAGWPAPEWTGTVAPYFMVRYSIKETAAYYK